MILLRNNETIEILIQLGCLAKKYRTSLKYSYIMSIPTFRETIRIELHEINTQGSYDFKR